MIFSYYLFHIRAKILASLFCKIPGKTFPMSWWGQILKNCPGRDINICAGGTARPANKVNGNWVQGHICSRHLWRQSNHMDCITS